MTRRGRAILCTWLFLGCATRLQARPLPLKTDLVRIQGGKYVPLYQFQKLTGGFGFEASVPPVRVKPFLLERYLVTHSQFRAFLRKHRRWRRSQVKAIFAEKGYLQDWTGDLEFNPALGDTPVVYVSWFAARAYCESLGRRLPTQDEWEFVARANETQPDASRDEKFRARILEWYSRPTPVRLGRVGSTFKNLYGIYDLHGLVWEWVDDFNSQFIAGESRADGSVDRGLFCAAGASSSTDSTNYAAFMRYAFRASLQARYVVANLGFRCAADLAAQHSQTATPARHFERRRS